LKKKLRKVTIVTVSSSIHSNKKHCAYEKQIKLPEKAEGLKKRDASGYKQKRHPRGEENKHSTEKF
jgi:hypothetical protein